MPQFSVTYTIAKRQEPREVILSLASAQASSRAVARAILKKEFPELIHPFGIHEMDAPELVLRRFSITNVKAAEISKDGSHGPAKEVVENPRNEY